MKGLEVDPGRARLGAGEDRQSTAGFTTLVTMPRASAIEIMKPTCQHHPTASRPSRAGLGGDRRP